MNRINFNTIHLSQSNRFEFSLVLTEGTQKIYEAYQNQTSVI